LQIHRFSSCKYRLKIRVSDPYSFFTDPDPDPVDPDGGQYGSGYGSGSGSETLLKMLKFKVPKE
jgi:hypothetical protein